MWHLRKITRRGLVSIVVPASPQDGAAKGEDNATENALFCAPSNGRFWKLFDVRKEVYVPSTVLLSSLFRLKKRITEVRKVREIMSLPTFMLFTLLF